MWSLTPKIKQEHKLKTFFYSVENNENDEDCVNDHLL